MFRKVFFTGLMGLSLLASLGLAGQATAHDRGRREGHRENRDEHRERGPRWQSVTVLYRANPYQGWTAYGSYQFAGDAQAVANNLQGQGYEVIIR
jgi:hypothetical protein